jgi:hypothetical protein
MARIIPRQYAGQTWHVSKLDSNYILYIALLKYVNCLGILFFQIIKIDSCNIFVWCTLWFFHVSFMYDVNDCLVYGEHAYALFHTEQRSN